MNKTKSDYFIKARRVISGGVNSPVRAWKSVGGKSCFCQLKQKAVRFTMFPGKNILIMFFHGDQ